MAAPDALRNYSVSVRGLDGVIFFFRKLLFAMALGNQYGHRNDCAKHIDKCKKQIECNIHSITPSVSSGLIKQLRGNRPFIVLAAP